MAHPSWSNRLNTVWGQLVFLVLLILVTTVPVVLLGVYTYRAVFNSSTSIALDRRVSLARLSAASAKERLDRIRELVVLYSKHDEIITAVAKGDWEQAAIPLRLLPTVIPYIDRSFITDPKGIEMVAFPDDPSVIGRDFSFREWYQGVSKNWKPYVSGVYQRAAMPQINLVAVAAPIFKNEGDSQPIGILVFQVPVSSFASVLMVEGTEEGFLYLVDKNGNLVFHPRYQTEEKIISFWTVPPVEKVLIGTAGYIEFYHELEKEQRLSAFWPIPEYGWGAVMAEPAASVFAERDLEVRRVGLVWLVVTLIDILLSFILFRFVVMLAEQREREHLILESLAESIIVVDTKAKITQVNEAAVKLTGFARDELVGQRAPSFFQLYDLEGKEIPQDDRPFPKVARFLKPDVSQIFLRNKSGDMVPVLIVASPILYGELFAGAVAVISDFTERYQLDKAKDEFITTAAHQLNSPLGQIRWNLDLFIKKYASKLSLAAKTVLHDAHDSTVSLAALVNDLLVASRVTQNRLQEHPVAFKPVRALKDLIGDLEPFIKEKNLAVTLRPIGSVPELVLDQLAFRQVFENLLRNAIKYNHKGGNVEVILQKVDDMVQITVADTGIGIPKKDLGSLFGKFYRASNVTKNGLSGTGLGLFVVKAYVERWKGKVWIESELGKGTTVFVKIPRTYIRENSHESNPAG